ncbi:unnamed protein product [Peniophora sp. CBMAI 1063]|nr:unnamed protein product [Peniophora sp. CBMAI 1063]
MPAHSRSFRFSHHEEQKFDAYAVCNRPVDLTWLLNAPTLPDTIPVDSVELDSYQNLILLLHYDQPNANEQSPHGNGAKVFPVQLDHAVNPGNGLTNAHEQARRAMIDIPFTESDLPDGGPDDTMEIEMKLCGDYFSLFFRYTVSQRVVIYSWKTGEMIATIDSDRDRSDTRFLETLHPGDVTQFAWFSPDAFAILSTEAHLDKADRDPKFPSFEDALYLYQLSGEGRASGEEPGTISRSVALELPRWRSSWRHEACRKLLKFVTSSWNEDVYPGSLSFNATQRVTVLMEDYAYDEKPIYNIRYVLRNDLLVNFLLQSYDGQELRWEYWGPTIGAAVFENPSNLSDIQVCGMMVLTVLRDDARNITRIESNHFNPLDHPGPGDLLLDQAPITPKVDIFEQGQIYTTMVYRTLTYTHPGTATQFLLRTGCVYSSLVGKWGLPQSI